MTQTQPYRPVIYWQTYTYKIGPFTTKGTAFYKDKDNTSVPTYKDPYKALRKSPQIVTINGFQYIAIKL